MTSQNLAHDGPAGNDAAAHRRDWEAANRKVLEIGIADTERCLAQSVPGGRAPHPWMAASYKRRLAAMRTEVARQAAASLRQARAATAAPTSRPISRAPRRPRSAPARAVSRVDADDGGEGPPPLLVDQHSAPRLLGWSGRRFVAYLKRSGIGFGRDRRLYVCRLSDVLESLGIAAPPGQLVGEPAPAPAPTREATILLLNAGSRRKAGAR
jgi:hypothetical protein